MKQPPYLKKQGHAQILMVQNSPFFMLAGEPHNSSSSSVDYMEGVWDRAEALGLNTLLLPISWETLEPEEGKFDFTLTDGLIFQARERGKHLILLWFGSWKNAECMYAPAWVKTDTQRFRRGQIVKGKNKSSRGTEYPIPYTTLSSLCRESLVADAKAFACLMAHLRDFDSEEQTVVAVQVENEPGLLGAAREASDEADALFEADVPEELSACLRVHLESMVPELRSAIEQGSVAGGWRTQFGSMAEEVFTAYHTARYVEYVAAQGKKEYPLPMAVNCWLDNGGAPGDYPAGGPISKVREVWRHAAPSIDLYGPDIYTPAFCQVCDEYTRRGEALFIPECAIHSYSASRLVYAVGHYHALACSPFGFEDMGQPFTAEQASLFGVDVTDPALNTPQDPAEYRKIADYLNGLAPILLEKYGTGELQAVCGERMRENVLDFGTFNVYASFDHPFLHRQNGVCLGVKTAADSCILLASQCVLYLESGDPAKPYLDVLSLEEGEIDHGVWHTRRRLNGDEGFLKIEAPTLLRLRVFTYD